MTRKDFGYGILILDGEFLIPSEKGNKAAGTKARRSALELSTLFKEFRKFSIEEGKK